jgi:BlaI family penicillinase repressor
VKRRIALRSRKVVPTNAELLILNVLWEVGEGTVDDVVERLPANPSPNYKTIQSLLRIMETKKLVQHSVRGRAFVFRARTTRDEVGGTLAKRLLDRTFQGSATALMMNLLDRNAVDADELDELEGLIQEYRERKTKERSSK